MIEDTLIEDTLEIENKSDNKKIVKKYLDKWYTYRDSKMLEQEYALSTLFQHFYQNNNLQNVVIYVINILWKNYTTMVSLLR